MSTHHQPALQLTTEQEAHVLKSMMNYLRTLPPETSTVEKVQQLRTLKLQWIREALGQPDAK